MMKSDLTLPCGCYTGARGRPPRFCQAAEKLWDDIGAYPNKQREDAGYQKVIEIYLGHFKINSFANQQSFL